MSLEKAAGFVALCERYGWHFSLTPQADIHVVVGDDVGAMPQAGIFATISALSDEIKTLLAEQIAGQRVH